MIPFVATPPFLSLDDAVRWCNGHGYRNFILWLTDDGRLLGVCPVEKA